MMTTSKKRLLASACALGLLAAAPAHATDWLMLQGTEPSDAGGRAKVWGFLQPTYQEDLSKSTAAEPTRIGPNLERQSQFQLMRAQLGVRGTAMPIDNHVNYFVLAEFGTNAATDGGKYGHTRSMRLMDASVTLNYVPGARLRIGQFKTPGPEEILQGIISFNYINFTDVANQLMLERYPAGVNSTANGDGRLFPNEATWSPSFSAGRDQGAQLFDTFVVGNWHHSYAVMLGNGNGVQTSASIADGPDTYLYWSSEYVYGGKGPFQQGLKMFVWHQSGKRRVDLSDDGVTNPISHDRTRQGVGVRYRRGDWRLASEYMSGKGMIFQGPEKPNMGIGPAAAMQALDGKANGWYADAGYYVPNSRWELDARYDEYNRSTDNQYISAKFTTWTLGFNYHFNRKTRFTFNYLIRDDKAQDAIPSGPLSAPSTALHKGLADIGNRYALQVTTIF